MKSTRRGFTLIELLVVIAIIGILSSVVIASMNTTRAKARDTKRLSDVSTLRNALELYADVNNGNYPATANFGDLVTDGHLAVMPQDPSTNANYEYCSDGDTAYHLAALLENTGNSAFDTDVDRNSDVCTAGDFVGLSTDCAATAATNNDDELCYDVTP